MQSMFTTPNVQDGVVLWATLAVLIVLFLLVGNKATPKNVELKSDTGYKQPMMAFEFNSGDAEKMFTSWDEATKQSLRIALFWDYLFIFIYPAALATACFIAARFLDSRGIIPFKYGLVIICLQLVAALFDATENFALLKVLDGATANWWSQLARWCAFSKFGLVIVGGFYAVVIGGGTWLVLLIKGLFVGKAA